MSKILFICKGNVGRSQIAEAYYNYFSKSNLAISAGVKQSSVHYGRNPLPIIVNLMSEDGISIQKARVKRLTKNMLNQVEKIIVFCEKERCPKYLTSNNKTIFLPIEDPYGKPIVQLRKTRTIIKKIVLNLL